MKLDHDGSLAADALPHGNDMSQRPVFDDDWQQLTRTDGLGLHVLFERHKDYVFRLACGFLGDPQLAEDVTQEVFLRIAQQRRRRWRTDAKFTTWLYRVSLNTARELQRKQPCMAQLSLQGNDEPSAISPAGTEIDLQRALSALSERQREVVLLRFYEGLSTAETARVLRCRQGTVKTHLHRATATLQRLLNTHP